jgi:hypothetical protein
VGNGKNVGILPERGFSASHAYTQSVTGFVALRAKDRVDRRQIRTGTGFHRSSDGVYPGPSLSSRPSAPTSSDKVLLNSGASLSKDIWVVESGAGVGDGSRTGSTMREARGG